MNEVTREITQEAMIQIAAHYASKIAATGAAPTREELNAAISQNWEKISGEIAKVSTAAAALI